jgi:hypothetical protein
VVLLVGDLRHGHKRVLAEEAANTMKTLLITFLFCLAVLTTQAQNNVAFQLMSKEWTPDQEFVMMRAINYPSKTLEVDVAVVFTRSQARKVFGSPVVPSKAFKTVSEMETLLDKNRYLNTLPDEEWASAWRWWLSTKFAGATPEQQGFLIRFGRSLDSKELAKGFDVEALKLFGPAMFSTVGPFKSVGSCIQNSRGKLSSGNCYCSIGSSFNMQCENDCTSSQGNGCTTTDGTCGFLGLYNCDGGCRRDGENPIDPPEGE